MTPAYLLIKRDGEDEGMHSIIEGKLVELVDPASGFVAEAKVMCVLKERNYHATYNYHCRYVAILHCIDYSVLLIYDLGRNVMQRRQREKDGCVSNTDPEGYWVQVLNYYYG